MVELLRASPISLSSSRSFAPSPSGDSRHDEHHHHHHRQANRAISKYYPPPTNNRLPHFTTGRSTDRETTTGQTGGGLYSYAQSSLCAVMPPSPSEASCAVLRPTSPLSQHSSSALPTPPPPSSCHPALLVEDDIASAHRATIYARFHKSLCERLHQVLLSQRRQRQRQRQHSPDADRIPTSARPAVDQHIQHAPIRDTVARQPSSADRSYLKRRRDSETQDEPDASSKQPRHHRPSARPRKRTARPDAFQGPLMLPDRADTLLPVTKADDPFSWWRPLTPSPSITPEESKRHGAGDNQLTAAHHDCEKERDPHTQIHATSASDDRSIQVSGGVYNSPDDT
jgi:hypothetical protein